MKRTIILLSLAVTGFVTAFPPVDFFPAALLALAGFGLAFHAPIFTKKAWLITYLAGILVFLFGCMWISETTFISLLLMAVAEGTALVLFCLLFRRMVYHQGLPVPVWLALPVAWVAVEYFRSIFPLDGYPWLIAGYTLWHCSPLIQIADVTGVYGISFLLAMGGGLLAAWIIHLENKAERKPWKGTWLFLVVLAAIFIYGVVKPQTLDIKEGPVVAAVQGNIPQELKDNQNSVFSVYQRYREETEKIFAEGAPVPSLVVWPETIYLFPIGEGKPGDRWFQNGEGYSESVRLEKRLIKEGIVEQILAPHGAWFLTGVIAMQVGRDGTVEERNGAYLYSPSGERRGAYYKTILVPGGEYLPFIDVVPFGDAVRSYVEEAAGYLPALARGFGPQIMHIQTKGQDFKIGVQICFENIYGDYCRSFIKKGADFLINISNEGWFKTSSEFDQMLAMSVFRAVETRRSLFRSTNTGISCLIGPEGRIPRDEEKITSEGRDRAVKGVLVQKVPLCSEDTLYTRWGDFFAKGVLGFQILILLAGFVKRS